MFSNRKKTMRKTESGEREMEWFFNRYITKVRVGVWVGGSGLMGRSTHTGGLQERERKGRQREEEEKGTK